MAFRTQQAEIRRLMLDGKSIRYRKGQVLQSSDDTLRLSMVKSGFVKRYLISNDGTLSIQIIYGEGDIFPLTHVYRILLDQEIYNGPETYYYETLCDTEIVTVGSDQLLKAVADNPLLFRDFFSVAGRHLQSTIQVLENSSLHSSYQKVAQLLAVYGHEFGEPTSNGGVKIKMPITHLLLANVLNITRETVSQSMIQLRAKKLIKTGKYIVVPDLKKLEQEAYGQIVGED